ncbi:MAG: ABC transporter substrate-binding protein [Beijerinckiaceae bacterium]
MLKTFITACICWILASAPCAYAADSGPVKIGVLTDLSGLYADIGGPGAVDAVRMAVEDFDGSVLGRPIEVIEGDTQNKPDVAAAIARQWYDVGGVKMIIDLPSSPIALAVQKLSKDKDRVSIVTGAGSDTLTGKDCSPTGVHWVYDTYSTGKATVDAVVQRGGDSWFLVQLDQVFGAALAKEVTVELAEKGGKLVGVVRHPLNTSDFSSFILQAQASKAKVVGLANAGGDTINSLKQAQEFRLMQGGQQLVSLLMFISDVKSIGLQAAQGLLLTEAFYWDLNDESRAFSKRFFERNKRMPTSNQAGDYSATLHYLKAVKAAGTDDAMQVMAKMRAMPIKDPFTQDGRLRVDGRMVHDIYLMQVKKPEESKGPWDVYQVLQTIPGDQAFRPLSESDCPLVKRE